MPKKVNYCGQREGGTRRKGRWAGWVAGGTGSPLPGEASANLQETCRPANITAEGVGKELTVATT